MRLVEVKQWTQPGSVLGWWGGGATDLPLLQRPLHLHHHHHDNQYHDQDCLEKPSRIDRAPHTAPCQLP